VGINVARKSDREAGDGSSVRKRSRNPALNVKPEVALASTRNIRELDSLTPAFVRWYAGQQYRTDVRVVLQHLTGFFHDYPESNRTGPITALEPTEVAPKVATLILGSVDEGVIATICLHEFVLFLGDSGLWTGSQESYRGLDGFLREIIVLDLNWALRNPQATTAGISRKSG
jgi:hypothetical protein